MALEDDVRAIVQKAPGTFGVYARNLGTDETVAVNAHKVLPTESAAKTFMLVHYARLVADGKLDPARRIELTEADREMLFRQQFVDFLPRRLPHAYQSVDFNFLMPVRVFNKTGSGLGTCVDSGRFETDTAVWIVAATATEQTDVASRADDAAPSAFAAIGELLYERWGAI